MLTDEERDGFDAFARLEKVVEDIFKLSEQAQREVDIMWSKLKRILGEDTLPKLEEWNAERKERIG